MNTTKKSGLLLLALSFSGAALALPSVLPLPGAAPQLFPYQPVGGNTYALFFLNNKTIKSSPGQELATLKAQLLPSGLSPCLVSADVNATPINCGNGLVSFGANEQYSYGRPINLQKLPLTLNKGVKQVYAANFRSPVGLIPGDKQGKVVDVHFNQPVAQFAMNFDSGQVGAPSIYAVKFVMGTGVNQVALTQVLQPGTQWAGVQVPAGFTDLAVIPMSDPRIPATNQTTTARAFVGDQFSVVTKAQFVQ